MKITFINLLLSSKCIVYRSWLSGKQSSRQSLGLMFHWGGCKPGAARVRKGDEGRKEGKQIMWSRVIKLAGTTQENTRGCRLVTWDISKDWESPLGREKQGKQWAVSPGLPSLFGQSLLHRGELPGSGLYGPF